jgi:hypothetical protein
MEFSSHWNFTSPTPHTGTTNADAEKQKDSNLPTWDEVNALWEVINNWEKNFVELKQLHSNEVINNWEKNFVELKQLHSKEVFENFRNLDEKLRGAEAAAFE